MQYTVIIAINERGCVKKMDFFQILGIPECDFKLKSKTDRYYIIDNDRFNIGICQNWAYVLFYHLL